MKTELILHSPEVESNLSNFYKRAFENAVELFIVSAYFTEWDDSLKLNSHCHSFRVIIGKDFGITRKAACSKLMNWLPSKLKGSFKVADRIGGFHPKAVLWKEANGDSFAIIGSSNLTKAAFQTNYEANIFCKISDDDYLSAKKWVKNIEKNSVIVSDDWLNKYSECLYIGKNHKKGLKKDKVESESLFKFELPKPTEIIKIIKERRNQLEMYKKNEAGLTKLFHRCANKEISSEQFYKQLQIFWSWKVGSRLSGKGFEIKGKHSDFQELSKSIIKIIDANEDDRDDIVSNEIDRLCAEKVPTRKAFLSEMLCLRFPEQYPLINQPVENYLKRIKFKAPKGASEGVRYIHLATTLRSSLIHNPDHPAKNLAELDSVIWRQYYSKNK